MEGIQMTFPESKMGKYTLVTLSAILVITVIGGGFFYFRPIAFVTFLQKTQLRMKGFESKTVQTDSNRIHYWVGGEGVPLILVHTRAADFFSVMPGLAKHNRVYSIDLPGFGESDIPEGADYSPEFQANQIINFMKSLQISKADLLGDCDSGITQLVAYHWPESVDKLVLVSAAYTYKPELYDMETIRVYSNPKSLEDVRKFVNILNVDMFPDFVLKDLLRILQSQSIIIDRSLKSAVAEGRSWSESNFAKIKTPTLIIFGKQDTVIPEAIVKTMHRKMPKSVLITFDECKHISMGDLCHDRVFPEIEKFLAGESHPTGSTIEIPAQ